MFASSVPVFAVILPTAAAEDINENQSDRQFSCHYLSLGVCKRVFVRPLGCFLPSLAFVSPALISTKMFVFMLPRPFALLLLLPSEKTLHAVCYC